MRSPTRPRAVSMRTGAQQPRSRSVPADVEPVAAGQHDVEHDRVVVVDGRLDERGVAVGPRSTA